MNKKLKDRKILNEKYSEYYKEKIRLQKHNPLISEKDLTIILHKLFREGETC